MRGGKMLQHRNGCAPKMGLLNKITKKKNAARIKKRAKYFARQKLCGLNIIQSSCANLCLSYLALRFQILLNVI